MHRFLHSEFWLGQNGMDCRWLEMVSELARDQRRWHKCRVANVTDSHKNQYKKNSLEAQRVHSENTQNHVFLPFKFSTLFNLFFA